MVTYSFCDDEIIGFIQYPQGYWSFLYIQFIIMSIIEYKGLRFLTRGLYLKPMDVSLSCH